MKRHDGDIIDIVTGLIICPVAFLAISAAMILIGG